MTRDQNASGNHPTANGAHATASPPPEVPAIPLSPERSGQPGDSSVGDLVRDATTHLSTLIRSELELAKAELTSEVRKGVRGSIYFVLALAILIFSLFFLFIALGETLSIWLHRAASFGIVFGVMLLAAALFGLLGYRRVRSIRKPERTINAVRSTTSITRRGDQSGT